MRSLDDLSCSLARSQIAGARTFVQQFVDAEVALQFEVRPVIERISQRVRDGARPGQKFVAWIGGAGDVSFGNAVRAHRAPFVVVAFEPRFEKIVEAAIGGDVGGRKMRVIVEDRLGCGVGVVEAARGFGVQEEVVVDEGHHGSP